MAGTMCTGTACPGTVWRGTAWRGMLALALVVVLTGCGSQVDPLGAGIDEIRSGNYRKAARLLKKAVKTCPDSPSSHVNLGIAYWRMGMSQRALPSFRQAADLAPDDTRALELMANVLCELGQWQEASETLHDANETDPSARILTLLAVVELQSGSVQAAQTFLKEALELDDEYPPALYNMALVLRDRLGRKEDAAQQFRRYLEVADPADRHVQVARLAVEALDTPAADPLSGGNNGGGPGGIPVELTARELLRKGRDRVTASDFDGAMELLRKARRVDAGDPDVLWELAQLYDRHLSAPQEAEATYRVFRREFPDDPRSSEPDRVAERTTEGATADPGGEAGGGEAGGVEETTVRDPGTAAEQPPVPVPHVESAADRRVRALRVWGRGLQCQREGKTDDAIALYRQSFSIDDTLVSACYNLGLAYKEKGDILRARDAFAASVSIEPDMIDARYMLAVTHRNLHATQRAISELNTVLSMDRNYSKAHLLLGITYRERRQRELARRHFSEFVRLEPRSQLAIKARKWLTEQ